MSKYDDVFFDILEMIFDLVNEIREALSNEIVLSWWVLKIICTADWDSPAVNHYKAFVIIDNYSPKLVDSHWSLVFK